MSGLILELNLTQNQPVGQQTMKLGFLSTAIFLASTLVAQAAVYECEMTNRSRDGWITAKSWVEISDDSTEVQMYDGHIASVVGKKSMPVQFKRRGENKFMVRYTLEDLAGSQGGTTVDYRATFDRAALKIRYQAFVRGYDNNTNGSGTCKKIR